MSQDDAKRGDGCLTVEPLLSSYAGGALDDEGERRVRDHLVACAECRTAVAGRDPSVLFLELRRAPLPDGFWDGFAAGLRKRLEAEGRPRARMLGWTAAFSARRLAYVGAPLVMILLLGTLLLVRPGAPGFHGVMRPGTVRSPFTVPPGSPQIGRQGAQGPGQSPGPSGLPALPSGTGGPPLLEEVESPGARVYTFSVGEGGDATPIFFVVDESIDI